MSADRDPSALRSWSIERGASPHAEGSALVTAGRTRVLCTASVLRAAPGWLAGTGRGWVTASYDMLPRATHDRRAREDAGTVVICLKCGYDLRASPERCPECGTPRENLDATADGTSAATLTGSVDVSIED